MSEQIKVGDLVMIKSVAGYCDCHSGMYRIVLAIVPYAGHFACARCGDSRKLDCMFAELSNPDKQNGGWPIERLKRIDPPSIPESIETREPALADGRAG